jgi:hypothetical protein
VLALLTLAGLITVVWLAGLPGRIAIARKHPDAAAVKIMGYAGFLAGVPWIQAFIWAFTPTDIVDIRRMPRLPRTSLLSPRTCSTGPFARPPALRTHIRALHPLHAILSMASQGQAPANESDPSCWERANIPNIKAVPQRPLHTVLRSKCPLRLTKIAAVFD